MRDLIPDGHKFACLCVTWRGERDLDELVRLPGERLLTTSPPFPLLEEWHEAFGSMFADEISRCNLYLLATMPSSKPGVLDDENIKLKKQCELWLYSSALLQQVNLSWAVVSGAKTGGRLRQRSFTRFASLRGRSHAAAGRLKYPRPRINAELTGAAAALSDRVITLGQRAGGFQRFRWGLAVWQWGLYEMRAMDRLHQFVRSLDGIIRPRQGKSRTDFIRRCRTIIGTEERLEGLPDELYRLRSAAEHLNGHDVVFNDARVPGQEWEIRLALRNYQAERIAGYAYARVLGDAELLEHFETDDGIDTFWSLCEEDRRAIWGAPMAPAELLLSTS